MIDLQVLTAIDRASKLGGPETQTRAAQNLMRQLANAPVRCAMACI